MSTAAPAKKEAEAGEKFDRTFTFQIRRHRDGSFKNLWELRAKMHGKESVLVVDADALDTIIDKIGFLFEQEGY